MERDGDEHVDISRYHKFTEGAENKMRSQRERKGLRCALNEKEAQ